MSDKPPSGATPAWPLVAGLGALLGVALIAETMVKRHPYFQAADMIGFAALAGLGVGAALVAAAWVWARLLRREEEFYDD